MIRIGDLFFFEVPASARNIKVIGLNTYSYTIGDSLRESKAPFNIGVPAFDVIGHIMDIFNDDALIKRMLPDSVSYTKYNYVSWKEALMSWVEANGLTEQHTRLCAVRFSSDGGFYHYFNTLPKKAVKLSDSDIELTRLIPGKRKKYKTNKYGNDIIVNGKKMLEIANFEVTPNIYYTITTDTIAGEPQYHIVRNTCSFIAQCIRDDKNAFLEMLKFQKKWRDRINILMREEL